MSPLQRALRHKSFAVGFALTALLVLAAALSLVWTPWPWAEIDIPQFEEIFGLRFEDTSVKIPRAVEHWFSDPKSAGEKRIRAAIEADPKNPRRILTVRGVGYVFARQQD